MRAERVHPRQGRERLQCRTLKACGDRQLYLRAHERWMTEEDQALIQAFEAGNSVASLSSKHQRQPSAICSCLEKLGLHAG